MKYLPLIIFLAACGTEPVCEEPTFTAAGLAFCVEEGLDVDPAEVEHLAALLEEKVNELHPEISGLSEVFADNEVTVNIQNGDVGLNCVEISEGISKCDKVTGGATAKSEKSQSGMQIFVSFDPCLNESALIHELLHIIQILFIATPPPDDTHNVPGFFYEPLVGNSVETQVREGLGCGS